VYSFSSSSLQQVTKFQLQKPHKMVTILPASFSTTSYSWHYKDDNQSLWKVKETQSEIIPSTNEDTGKKTSVETFFRRQSCIAQYLCGKESCILKCNQVAREKTSTHGWVFIFSKLKCILQALHNHIFFKAFSCHELSSVVMKSNPLISPSFQSHITRLREMCTMKSQFILQFDKMRA
jgi:hypothetical protein